MEPGFEPVAKDEVLYRRVRLEHYDRTKGGTPSPEAFRPNEHDIDGLSLRRAKYTTVELAARGRSGKSYWVARLQAESLVGLGLTLKPDDESAEESEKGHCVIPELTYATRKSDDSESWQQQLAWLVSQVDGPFATP